MNNVRIDLTKLLQKTKQENTTYNSLKGDKTLVTTDLVKLHSWDELKKKTREQRMKSLTDAALLNFGWINNHAYFASNGKPSGYYFSRSASDVDCVKYVYCDGSRDYGSVKEMDAGLAPALSLNLESLISARSACGDFYTLEHKKHQTAKINILSKWVNT